MLYQIYEAQRSLTEPFADFAKAASRLFSNPSYPFTETSFANRVSAAYDLLYRLGKDYEKPVFGIRSVEVNGVEVAIQERVEMEKPFCELRRFKRYSDNLGTLEGLLKQPVVLIVAPLSGHYATLLRETVRTMLADHRVYITDWKNARLVPLSEGDFHLDDYVNYVQDFIRYLQGKYGNCHVMSVCQPTVPVLAAISLMATRGEKTPLSMTMMGGPIDARKSPTAVNALAESKSFEWFENNLIYRVPRGFPGEGRRVYPGFLQYVGFVAMNPSRHATSHYDYFKNLIKGDDGATDHHRKFYDEYNAVLDMDANYYLQTIKTVFQDFSLVHGTWKVRNPEGELELVRPQDIKTTALITVEGELDDISGSGQTRAAHSLCRGIPKEARDHIDVKGAGHYGIFSGSRWRKQVYPKLREFYQRFPTGPETLDAGLADGNSKHYIINEDSAPSVLKKRKAAVAKQAKAKPAAKAVSKAGGKAAKKAATPKAEAKQAGIQKPAVEKTVAKTASAKTATAKTTTAKAAAAKTAAAKTAAAKTAVAKTAVAKTAVAKTAAAKAGTTKTTSAKAASAKAATAKPDAATTAVKATAKTATAKTVAKKAVVKKAASNKAAPAAKKPAGAGSQQQALGFAEQPLAAPVVATEAVAGKPAVQNAAAAPAAQPKAPAQAAPVAPVAPATVAAAAPNMAAEAAKAPFPQAVPKAAQSVDNAPKQAQENQQAQKPSDTAGKA